jgi:hypothetical protein
MLGSILAGEEDDDYLLERRTRGIKKAYNEEVNAPKTKMV